MGPISGKFRTYCCWTTRTYLLLKLIFSSVKFVLLCSSSEKKQKNICQNKPFLFFGPYIAIGQKKGAMSTFFGLNKKRNHKLSNAFYFIKISYVINAEFIEFF